MIKKLACFLLIFSGSGCGASLDSTPYPESSLAKKEPVTGVVYHLPATDLVVSVTYELLKCPDPKTGAESLDELVRLSDVAIEMQLVPERTENGTIVVDQPAGGWFQSIKNARLSLSKDGMLVSADFEASDKLRETLVTAVKLAASFGGVPQPFFSNQLLESVGATQTTSFNCSAETRRLVEARESIKKNIEDVVGKIPGMVAEDSPLGKARRKLLEEPSKSAKETLDAIDSYLAARQVSLQAANDKAKAIDKFRCRPELGKPSLFPNHQSGRKLLIQSPEKSVSWWCKPDELSDSRDAILAKWFILPKEFSGANGGSFRTALNNIVLVGGNDLCIIGNGPGCGTPAATAEKLEAYSGIYYRLPVHGIAEAVVGTLTVSNVSDWGVDYSKAVRVNQYQVDVAHLGRLARIPFKNGPFQDSLTSVKFHPNGAVDEIKYSSTRAIVPDVLGTVNDIRKAPGDAELEKLERETKLLEQRNKLLEQRKKNKELEGAE